MIVDIVIVDIVIVDIVIVIVIVIVDIVMKERCNRGQINDKRQQRTRIVRM